MNQEEIKLRVIPATGLLVAIYCFCIWMSQDFYPENAFGYALFGAIVVAICFYFTVIGMQTGEEFNESIPVKLKYGMMPTALVGLVSFVLFIVVTTYLTILYSNIKEKELKAFGKITTGEIISGYSLTGKNAVGVYDVTVEYKLDDGELIKSYTRVSPQEFSDYYVGKEVNVIYSSKNHKLIDLLTNDDEIKTYIKVDNKEIQIKNLIKLLSLNQSQVGIYLNSISYSWQYNSINKSWENRQKDILVQIESQKSINYITTKISPEKLNSEIDSLKFKRIDLSQSKPLSEREKIITKLISSDGTYEDNKFLLLIKTLPVGGDIQKIATIINVSKK